MHRESTTCISEHVQRNGHASVTSNSQFPTSFIINWLKVGNMKTNERSLTQWNRYWLATQTFQSGRKYLHWLYKHFQHDLIICECIGWKCWPGTREFFMVRLKPSLNKDVLFNWYLGVTYVHKGLEYSCILWYHDYLTQLVWQLNVPCCEFKGVRTTQCSMLCIQGCQVIVYWKKRVNIL